MDYYNKINKVYKEINDELILLMPINNKDFRNRFKKRLENEFIDFVVKCDEENNPPEIVDYNCLIARISWIENHQQKYINLIFGRSEGVIIVQSKYF